MAEVNAATGNWAGADWWRRREWRRRVAGKSAGSADQFIAMADLEIQQPQDAVDRLSPYDGGGAGGHADENQALLTVYAEALIRRAGDPMRRRCCCPWRRMNRDGAWRGSNQAPVLSWMAQLGGWIALVKPLLNPDSIEEQEDLAEALGKRAADKQGYPRDYGLAMTR